MADSASSNYEGVWGNRIGFGKSAALILVDFMEAYTTPGAPLYAPDVVEAVSRAGKILESARLAGARIIHTNIRYQPDTFQDGGIWVKKAPVMKDMVEGNPLAEFCQEVMPLTSELVISKQYPSSFFGTSLATTLHSQAIDTIVLMGCSTSGCIRATAVDGVQHGFRVMVLRDCVGDRHRDPHDANLFDIDSKYGDVISSKEYLSYLQE
ncbi:N-carbamoylsarcosine amidohydrolase [Endozoicomonas arenosclerae]|uniref:N-carbamoylsarcosine amidohydrolase n=1 Tax=Endozoicomonas arenosclerae TaxID=1633495 RepID=UPI000783DD61|nr:N-carbamoylsarcosine amidohydrolase [Endozoicomonas arenosclerae]